MLNCFNIHLSLSGSRTSAGDGCLFHLEPRASDLEHMKTNSVFHGAHSVARSARRSTCSCAEVLGERWCVFFKKRVWQPKTAKKHYKAYVGWVVHVDGMFF